MQWDICECRPLATPVPPYRANGAGHHRFAAVTLRSWQIVAARGLAPLAVCLRRVNGPSGLSGDLRMSGVPRLGRHRCSPYGLRSRKPESRNRLPGSGPPLPVRTVRERSGPGRMQVRESVPRKSYARGASCAAKGAAWPRTSAAAMQADRIMLIHHTACPGCIASFAGVANAAYPQPSQST